MPDSPEVKGGRAPIRVTLGELVEAVAAVTLNPTEQAAVVAHILRTRGGHRRFLRRDSRR